MKRKDVHKISNLIFRPITRTLLFLEILVYNEYKKKSECFGAKLLYAPKTQFLGVDFEIYGNTYIIFYSIISNISNNLINYTINIELKLHFFNNRKINH